MPNLFDAKAFNAEAFNYRVERVPNFIDDRTNTAD